MKFKLHEEYDILTEANLNRIINGHDKDGYVMISASRHDCLDGIIDNPSAQAIIDENNKRTTALKQDIKAYGYSYIPVYGGYRETGSEQASIEKSFIVFPYNNISGEYVDFDKFENDMKKSGEEYNQDAILVKKPHANPRFFYINSGEWDTQDFGNASINDVQKEYFTALKSWQDISLNRKNHNWNNGSKPQRFTYEESYLNFPPQTIIGANARHNSGELFSMEHYKK